MGFLNEWIGYFDRSYQQIKSTVLTRMQSKTPEITDHTEGNLYVKFVSVYGGIGEMMGYYIDNAAREAFIDACRRYESAVHLARLLDYRIRTSTPAYADIMFTLNTVSATDVTIPQNTEVKTDGNISFFTTQVLIIPIGSLVGTVPAVQLTALTGQLLGTSNGSPDQVFNIDNDVVDGRTSLTINSIGWAAVESFALVAPTDKVFQVNVTPAKQCVVRLGDGMSGAIPPGGQQVFADYSVTEGLTGNVEANTITTIVSTLTLPTGITITATNKNRASGGDTIESLTSLKKRIPLFVRTLNRAVARQDYIDIAELAGGVAVAGLAFSCGKTVDMYIVPNGGGIASGGLLTSVVNWFEDKRMVTTVVRAFSAGEVHVVMNINLTVLPQYVRTSVITAVKAALTTYLSYQKQKINGKLQLGDLYQTIENVEGVDFSSVELIVAKPYARPLETTTTSLNWTRTVTPYNTAQRQWRLTFLSPTSFQLYRDGVFQGIYSTGITYNLPEITFTVTANSYVANDRYEFYTYPYNQSIQLAEQSLLVAENADLTITGFGGL